MASSIMLISAVLKAVCGTVVYLIRFVGGTTRAGNEKGQTGQFVPLNPKMISDDEENVVPLQ